MEYMGEWVGEVILLGSGGEVMWTGPRIKY
jgi:hypothetical protein